MHPKLVRTWLMSHDRRFAKHRSFNHFLFNQKIRHDTNLKVSIRVKANDNRTRKLTNLVNASDFQERLRAAANDPLGEDARWISKSVIPFLKIAGSRVKWSSFERSNALTHLYAMNQFFGLSFLFVTLSPSMRNSPLAIRMCYCSQDMELKLPDLVSHKAACRKFCCGSESIPKGDPWFLRHHLRYTFITFHWA